MSANAGAIRASFQNELFISLLIENRTVIRLTETQCALLHLRYIERLQWLDIEERLYMSRSTLYRIEQNIIEQVLNI